MKLYKRFLQGFKRKKAEVISIGKLALVVPTIPALDNGIDDEFNKKILIHEWAEYDGNELRFGPVTKEMSYTPEDVKLIREIMEIPIVEKRFDGELELFNENNYGEVYA